jgi:hypothetical protein
MKQTNDGPSSAPTVPIAAIFHTIRYSSLSLSYTSQPSSLSTIYTHIPHRPYKYLFPNTHTLDSLFFRSFLFSKQTFSAFSLCVEAIPYHIYYYYWYKSIYISLFTYDICTRFDLVHTLRFDSVLFHLLFIFLSFDLIYFDIWFGSVLIGFFV